uniref:Ig-like domain-containing protein n=1 Tax=Mastacembelus armatus TaxID=205130 RepID=A0A3Q3LNI8_9TELE
ILFITAEPGDTVTLPCQAPRSSEILILQWTRPDLHPEYVFVHHLWSDPDTQHPSFKERVELKDSQMKDGDVSVTLKDVTLNDTGTYECRVIQTPGGIWMSTLHLNVAEAGEFLSRHITFVHVASEPGDTVTLPCQAPRSSEILILQWTRPDLHPEYVFVHHLWSDPDTQHPSFKERVELKDSQMKDGDVSVTLKDVTLNDTGTYECRVIQTPGGIWMSTLHLNVAEADIRVHTHMSLSAVYIYCELITVNKNPVLFDLHEGVEVPEYQDKQFSGRVQFDKDILREGRVRLHVSRLRTEDSGLYRCSVKTDIGASSGKCRLKVTGKLVQSS